MEMGLYPCGTEPSSGSGMYASVGEVDVFLTLYSTMDLELLLTTSFMFCFTLLGDAVVTVEGKRAEIALITCDDVDMTIGVDACYCKGMWITAEHPILWHSPHNKSEERTNPVWVMPQDVLEVQRAHSVDALFNFELSPGSSSVVINGVGVLTLGQEIGFDPDADALFGWGWKDNPIRKKYLPRVPDQ